MSRIELRGDRVIGAPEAPGLYAWYYRPVRPNKESMVATLTRLLSTQPMMSTKVMQRYGVRYVNEGVGTVLLGSDERSISSSINEAFECAPQYLSALLDSEQFIHFCRPIYIGIAQNLRTRIYSQHYVSLIDYWDETHRVGKLLKTYEDATVQFVMQKLDLPHSFALEARVMGISPRDLVVSAFPTSDFPDSVGPDADGSADTSTRRALERILQLLADPVCGRR